MTRKEKKELLASYFEYLVLNGFDIVPLMGRSLSYWNYDHVQRMVNKYKSGEEE